MTDNNDNLIMKKGNGGWRFTFFYQEQVVHQWFTFLSPFIDALKNQNLKKGYQNQVRPQQQGNYGKIERENREKDELIKHYQREMGNLKRTL